MMTLSLTFNHMVTDGGPAMSFLRTLADMLKTSGAHAGLSPGGQSEETMLQRYIIELGTGADLHGADMTKAARRAVKDAISRSCLCGLVEVLGRSSFQGVHVHAEIAVPDPAGVDVEAV